MKVMIGLGNPGRQYEDTRHNVGFMAIDKVSNEWQIPVSQNKFRALIGEGRINGERVLLVKPQTYMNLSGESVREIVSFYKLTPADILVVFDDLDLPVGRLKLKEKGSAGGHNGIKSLISHLGTQEFKRIKVGIGRPEPGRNVSDYVLGSFSTGEHPLIERAVALAAEACAMAATERFDLVMNRYNTTAG
ncbi:aminoacyl-tRNA hydrolase [Brevibacillus sp. B_LB10_24]|jgi:PTH1 family peptidyl-tRNA hydrolase|uniref:aminoacyl-tRNA hydrolase n=1 Tax=Brevibacillus TaxID=55080 RepID=UPI0003783866|nr:aminoacyl-tRNA hydrolase [Brevibacillus massiliensis]